MDATLYGLFKVEANKQARYQSIRCVVICHHRLQGQQNVRSTLHVPIRHHSICIRNELINIGEYKPIVRPTNKLEGAWPAHDTTKTQIHVLADANERCTDVRESHHQVPVEGVLSELD